MGKDYSTSYDLSDFGGKCLYVLDRLGGRSVSASKLEKLWMEETEEPDPGTKKINVLARAIGESLDVDFYYPWSDVGTATGGIIWRESEEIAALKAGGASSEEIDKCLKLQETRFHNMNRLISDYRDGGKCLVDRKALECLIYCTATACIKLEDGMASLKSGQI